MQYFLKRHPQALLLLLLMSSDLFAQATSALDQPYRTQQVNGFIALDYEKIPVPGQPSLDLFGIHYLHQLNDWFYLGVGLHAPLFYGEYGGFMTFDATAHIRKRLFGNLFVDAGSSLGGGGGGSSIEQSKLLSGTGGFSKNYLGLSYQFRKFSMGLAYSDFHFFGSLIDHSQISLYLHKPISFSIGPYLGPASKFENIGDLYCENGCSAASKSKVSVELNNIFQINPQGTYTGSINLLSLQYSHFINGNTFAFLEADAGIRGLPLYNQLLGGIGYQRRLSSRINAIGQLALGSGGFAPSEIDTGSGILVYPKFGVDYMAAEQVGLALTAGYLFAPKGSSKNATIGLAMNYYLSGAERTSAQLTRTNARAATRIRFNLYEQTKIDPKIKGEEHDDIHMITSQIDYIFSDHLYVPIQVSFAYNEYRSYPGYGEILLGLGLQSEAVADSRFQFFFQTLVGANVTGGMIKPELGINYGLKENFAIYSQAGVSGSLDGINKHTLRSYTLGLGLTYRFSIPN